MLTSLDASTSSGSLDGSSTSTLLFKKEGLEYHVLSKKYRDEVLMVLGRAFCSEPIVMKRGLVDARHKASIKDWVEFVDYWMDHCSTNGLSVMCLDPHNHRVAGAFIVRDLLMIPDGFDEKYSNEGNVLTPWMQFLWHMDRKATEVEPGLSEAGAAVDLWFLGVHPDYRGKRIATHMTTAVEPLITSAGYKYGTIEATSYFTSCAAASNKFVPIYNQEARDFEWMGQKPYINGADAPHGKWTFWIKKLQDSGRKD